MARMGDFGVVDYTPLMALAPRVENFLETLGLFPTTEAKYSDNRYCEFEREELGASTMYNVARGANRQKMGTEKARKEIFEVPFATLDGVTVPSEVEAFRQYGTEDAPASVESTVQRKIAHIQRSHGKYIRDVQYTALTQNKVHAFTSDGTEITGIAKNFSTVWGANRKTKTVDTTVAATDPFVALSEARQEILSDLGSNAGFETMALLLHPTDFNKIRSHAKVQAAYDGRDGGNAFLTQRLGNSKYYETFDHKGITLVEDTSGKLEAGSAFMLPLGVEDMFQSAFAPADTLDHVNQVSQGSYLFMKEDWRKHEMESEVAYMCMISRPELICNVTVA